MQTLGWMFKGLNRMELVGVLSGAKATMPPPAVDAVKKLGAATECIPRPGRSCDGRRVSDSRHVRSALSAGRQPVRPGHRDVPRAGR